MEAVRPLECPCVKRFTDFGTESVREADVRPHQRQPHRQGSHDEKREGNTDRDWELCNVKVQDIHCTRSKGVTGDRCGVGKHPYEWNNRAERQQFSDGTGEQQQEQQSELPLASTAQMSRELPERATETSVVGQSVCLP